ncbi:MAG: hypothetical protein GC147_04695 [Porphyrobacter sp.]|nr:hypothetical protein [Porphyrobacter sp.]
MSPRQDCGALGAQMVWRRAGARARRHVGQLEEEPDLPEPPELVDLLELPELPELAVRPELPEEELSESRFARHSSNLLSNSSCWLWRYSR